MPRDAAGRGHDVELWDVGREEPAFPEQGATFHELKDRLADPVAYFKRRPKCLVPPASPGSPCPFARVPGLT
jgi:hypothetical protein